MRVSNWTIWWSCRFGTRHTLLDKSKIDRPGKKRRLEMNSWKLISNCAQSDHCPFTFFFCFLILNVCECHICLFTNITTVTMNEKKPYFFQNCLAIPICTNSNHEFVSLWSVSFFLYVMPSEKCYLTGTGPKQKRLFVLFNSKKVSLWSIYSYNTHDSHGLSHSLLQQDKNKCKMRRNIFSFESNFWFILNIKCVSVVGLFVFVNDVPMTLWKKKQNRDGNFLSRE